ncbi:protein kinase, partial [Salmonella enterica]|uniref:protein kinase n=1 Tax=Salmonella enterica TaxID=28901 RepID=UPI0022B6577F
FGPLPGRPGLRLAFPFYPLGSLRDYLRRGETLSLRLKLRVLLHVARGMAYLNDQSRITGRILHGNLHSGNVLLAGAGGDPIARVADFAFSR